MNLALILVHITAIPFYYSSQYPNANPFLKCDMIIARKQFIYFSIENYIQKYISSRRLNYEISLNLTYLWCTNTFDTLSHSLADASALRMYTFFVFFKSTHAKAYNFSFVNHLGCLDHSRSAILCNCILLAL